MSLLNSTKEQTKCISLCKVRLVLAERELLTLVCCVQPLRKLQIQHNKGPFMYKGMHLVGCSMVDVQLRANIAHTHTHLYIYIYI
jgi:hypothetical protein